MARLSQEAIDRLQELAECHDYGQITVHLNKTAPFIDLEVCYRERVAASNLRPGMVVTPRTTQ